MADGIQVLVDRDADELAERAARFIAAQSREAIRARGEFTCVLSGGSTPEKTYLRLGNQGQDQGTGIDWQHTFLFFGDERCVPGDDPRSNFYMARRSLLSRVGVPDSQVYPMPGAAADADAAAREYSATIARHYGVLPDTTPAPAFDLVLLGLGDDGHTASLFPGRPALAVRDRWVVSSPPGRLPPPVDRLTMTYPLLNAARQVLFLVAGAAKADVVAQLLEGEPRVEEFPAAGVRPVDGQTVWMLDTQAARRLTRSGADPR